MVCRSGPDRVKESIRPAISRAGSRGQQVRFDDSLKTVLAADTSSAFGAQSAFRQIVDLVGRRRVPADPVVIARLRMLRAMVPEAVRAATARALALANPPAALVSLFADDDPAVSAPVLRIAALSDPEWSDLLPALGPVGRAVLRARDDLSPATRRSLDAFGSVDFTIGHDSPPVAAAPPRAVDRPVAPPQGPGPFVALGAIARDLPVVAEAIRQSERPPQEARRGFEIADLVDRIESFQRDRAANDRLPIPDVPEGFRFETDGTGTIRWADGGGRAALVGLDLAHGGVGATVDGILSGAIRQRTAFDHARLLIEGASAAGGDWRISGVPIFDPATGRFLGMRGVARRPRADQVATPAAIPANRAGGEALRRLVHELRTPTNAISGFAELIETEMLGPVPEAYRARAERIRHEAADLIQAIDDLDLAARIESDALDLRPGTPSVLAMLEGAAAGLSPLIAMRGCTVAIDPVDPGLTIAADEAAAARLIARLLAVLVAAAAPAERIAVMTVVSGEGIEIRFDRPVALANQPDHALLSIDADTAEAVPGTPLLGTGFALRLARNLARELGGSLTIEAARLTLRLCAGLNARDAGFDQLG